MKLNYILILVALFTLTTAGMLRLPPQRAAVLYATIPRRNISHTPDDTAPITTFHAGCPFGCSSKKECHANREFAIKEIHWTLRKIDRAYHPSSVYLDAQKAISNHAGCDLNKELLHAYLRLLNYPFD